MPKKALGKKKKVGKVKAMNIVDQLIKNPSGVLLDAAMDVGKRAYNFGRKLDKDETLKQIRKNGPVGRRAKLHLPRVSGIPAVMNSSQKFVAPVFRDGSNTSTGYGVEPLPMAGAGKSLTLTGGTTYAAGTILYSFPISVASTDALLEKSRLYEQYKFDGLKVVFVSGCGTTVQGSIAMLFVPDATEDFTTLGLTTAYNCLSTVAGIKQGHIYETFEAKPPTSGERGAMSPFWGRKYCDVTSAETPNLCYAGQFICMVTNAITFASTTTIGQLSFEYAITFYGRMLRPTFLSGMTSKWVGGGSMGSGVPFGTAPSGMSYNNIPFILSTSDSSFTLKGPGSYLVIAAIVGSTITNAGFAASTGTVVSSLADINSAATSACEYAQLNLTTDSKITWSVTAATVSAATLFVTALPFGSVTVKRPIKHFEFAEESKLSASHIDFDDKEVEPVIVERHKACEDRSSVSLKEMNSRLNETYYSPSSSSLGTGVARSRQS